jgi:hypothetical protein
MQNNTIDNKLNINKNSNFKLPKINVLNFVKFINMTKLSKASKASKISNIPKVLNGLKSPKDIKYNKLSSDIFNERSSVFIKDIKKNSILNNITKYLKNKKKESKKKYTLNDRIDYYKYVIKSLKKVNNTECLEKKLFAGKQGYTIKNIIDMVTKIGTESEYGVIFLTKINNKLDAFSIASKIMPNTTNNYNEVLLMKHITKEIIVKKKSRHFVMMYKYCVCKKKEVDENIKIVCINELAHGDLRTLMEKRDVIIHNDIITNLLFQTLISIGSFHNLIRYLHKDTHDGNFLYQTNTEKGYYDYLFQGQHYYLKSCGYNIMIYDFGLSSQIDDSRLSNYYNNISNIPTDYINICNAFINKKMGGWGMYEDLPNNQFCSLVRDIKISLNEIRDIAPFYNNQRGYFKYVIETVLIKHSPYGLLLTKRPLNVINIKPFNID